MSSSQAGFRSPPLLLMLNYSCCLRYFKFWFLAIKNPCKQINLDGSKLKIIKSMELFVKHQSLHNLLPKHVKYKGNFEIDYNTQSLWICSFQNLKRFFDNAIFSNRGSSCKETFSCNGVLGFLYFRVNELTDSLLQIHAIVAGSNLIETYEFGDNNSTLVTKKWYKSTSSEIIIDYTAFNRSSNYSLEVECRNIELLHNQDALVYFQRKFLKKWVENRQVSSFYAELSPYELAFFCERGISSLVS